ncbi:MAG: hypothetical protein WBX25_09920 [Rhodomicrobium sp.]
MGPIGNSLKELSKRWNVDIPPIQCVVVSKTTGILGPGIKWFLNIPEVFKTLFRARQREIINAKLQDIFTYTRWRGVLQALGLSCVPPDFDDRNRAAAAYRGTGIGLLVLSSSLRGSCPPA